MGGLNTWKKKCGGVKRAKLARFHSLSSLSNIHSIGEGVIRGLTKKLIHRWLSILWSEIRLFFEFLFIKSARNFCIE